MRADEFASIAAVIQGRWSAFPIPAASLDQYHQDLRDLDAEKVAAAVDSLHVEGMARVPTAGQIRRRVAELELNVPTWDEARVALVAWRRPGRARARDWECPYDLCDGSGFEVDDEKNLSWDCKCRPAMREARLGLGELPPMVAEFVADGHMSIVEFDDMLTNADTTAEAQIRTRWSEFTRRAVDSQVLAALGPGAADLPRIEAARVEAEHRGQRRIGQPHRLDVVALLERGAA